MNNRKMTSEVLELMMFRRVAVSIIDMSSSCHGIDKTDARDILLVA